MGGGKSGKTTTKLEIPTENNRWVASNQIEAYIGHRWVTGLTDL